MQNSFETMLSMQNRMNTKVHPDWIDQHFEWYRALWLECGELIDHYGYKWWKKQNADMEQVRLEIVDIWHFGMSMLFDGREIAEIAADMTKELESAEIVQCDVLSATEALAADVLSNRRFSIALFWSLLQAAEMDFSDLYEAYVGKNVLNFFRQDNGYQKGTYIKQWQGREDNEHLIDVLKELDSTKDNFASDLYQALEQRYQALTQEEVPQPA